MQTLLQFVIRARWVLAAVGFASLAAAYPISQRLETDQSIASLFRADDPTLNEYKNLRTWFGKDDVLVLMYEDESLASTEGIERNQRLT
ncbi:MAG: hypothetical protein AAGJ83_02425, partial [Planctomycetota bacterium]